MSTNNYITSSSVFEDILFTLECYIEDAKMELYVNEGIIITEAIGYDNITFVHEAFKDKMKAAFTKLMDTIKKLWAAFVEKMAGFFKKDSNYLKQYKDVILRKPLKEESYTMFPYWKGKTDFSAAKIPAFNFNSLIDNLESEEHFVKTYFGRFAPKKDKDFVQVAKEKFRGAEVPQKIASNTINITDMYNFCIGFDKKAKELETDMTNIEKAGNEAIRMLDKIKTESTDVITGDKSYYSYVLETVISEADAKVSATPQKASDKNGDGKPDEKANVATNPNDEKTTQDNIFSNGKDKNKDIDAVKMYIRVCYRFLGAKLSILEEEYKAYMFIIRDHVKSYNGDKVNSNDPKASESNDGKATTEEKPANAKTADTKEAEPKKKNIITRVKDLFKKESADIDEDFIIEPDDLDEPYINGLIDDLILPTPDYEFDDDDFDDIDFGDDSDDVDDSDDFDSDDSDEDSDDDDFDDDDSDDEDFDDDSDDEDFDDDDFDSDDDFYSEAGKDLPQPGSDEENSDAIDAMLDPELSDYEDMEDEFESIVSEAIVFKMI